MSYVAKAISLGKWAHRGRVNTMRRLLASQTQGYHSADGTFLAFGPSTNLPRLRRWIDAMAAQPPLGV